MKRRYVCSQGGEVKSRDAYSSPLEAYIEGVDQDRGAAQKGGEVVRLAAERPSDYLENGIRFVERWCDNLVLSCDEARVGEVAAAARAVPEEAYGELAEAVGRVFDVWADKHGLAAMYRTEALTKEEQAVIEAYREGRAGREIVGAE